MPWRTGVVREVLEDGGALAEPEVAVFEHRHEPARIDLLEARLQMLAAERSTTWYSSSRPDSAASSMIGRLVVETGW
jgi:hypothetical protein